MKSQEIENMDGTPVLMKIHRSPISDFCGKKDISASITDTIKKNYNIECFGWQYKVCTFTPVGVNRVQNHTRFQLKLLCMCVVQKEEVGQIMNTLVC